MSGMDEGDSPPLADPTRSPHDGSIKPKSKRGFAAMTPEKQREISSKGGKAAHAMGVAHEFTREKAIEAGRKGGKIYAERRAREAGEDNPRKGK
jgi:general stress protein YciG